MLFNKPTASSDANNTYSIQNKLKILNLLKTNIANCDAYSVLSIWLKPESTTEAGSKEQR